MFGLLLGLMLSMAFDGVSPRSDCDHADGLKGDIELIITHTEALDMPMENPVSYSNVSTTVLSSTYCRSLGKYRFNTIIPTIYDQTPINRQNFLELPGDNFLTSSLFSYASEYFIFGQRRILI